MQECLTDAWYPIALDSDAVGQAMQRTDFWANSPVILPIDTGAIRARDGLAAMIAEERHRGEV